MLWLVDNTAALSSLTKGCSGHRELDSGSTSLHLLFAHRGIRAWFEYIESKSNWTDSLSRDMGDETVLAELGFHVYKGAVPEWPWDTEPEQVVNMLKGAEARNSVGGDG